MFIRYFSEQYPEGLALRFTLKNIFSHLLFISGFSLLYSCLLLVFSFLLLLLGSLFDFSSWNLELYRSWGMKLLLLQNTFLISLILNLFFVLKLFFFLSLNGVALRRVLTKKVSFFDFFFTWKFLKKGFYLSLLLFAFYLAFSLICFSFSLVIRAVFSVDWFFDLIFLSLILFALYFLIRLIFVPHCLISFDSSVFESIRQSWRISRSRFSELLNFLILLLCFFGLLLYILKSLQFVFQSGFLQIEEYFYKLFKLLLFPLIESDPLAQRFLFENKNSLQEIFLNLKQFLCKSLFLDLCFAYLALGISRLFCRLRLDF